MKKGFILILLTLCFISNVDAQYRFHKMTYDITEYKYQKGDPYNPVICGIASFCIPGLGQAIAGEPIRGLTFMGGELVCLGIAVAVSDQVTFLSSSNDGRFDFYNFVFFTALIAQPVLRICGIVDAVKVAKVNNLTYRDKKNGISTNFQIQPFVFDSYFQNKRMAFGLTTRYKF
jgi:hypothetical protein